MEKMQSNCLTDLAERVRTADTAMRLGAIDS